MSAAEISKRALLGKGAFSAGLGVGALALLAPNQRVSAADTPFTSFAFQAAGAPASRTMPDRLSDIKNVKDWGAVGNGIIDDTAAIQAAINHVSAPFSAKYRGEIFFPPGIYRINTPLRFNDPSANVALESIGFRGVGDASEIRGNFADYLLKRDDNTSGNDIVSGIKYVEGLWFNNEHAAGGGLKASAGINVRVGNCKFTCFMGVDMWFTQSSIVHNCSFIWNRATGSFGIRGSESLTIIGCDCTALNFGARMVGPGCNLLGCRFEVNTIGIRVEGVTGCFINGCQMESNGTAIHFQGGSSFLQVSNIIIIGFFGAIPGQSPQYGIRCQDVINNATFENITCNPRCDIANIQIGGLENRGNVRFRNVSAVNATGVGVAWSIPSTQAHTATYEGCSANGTGVAPSTSETPVPFSPTFTFIMLPGKANGGAGGTPYAGETYYITDGNQATVGGNVTSGGGSNKSYVTYDGTNWKRGV